MKYLSSKPSLREVADSYKDIMDDTIDHAKGLRERLKKVGTATELKKIITEIDQHGYSPGIASVALYQFDWWAREMGYEQDGTV